MPFAVNQMVVSAGGTASVLRLQGLLASDLHPWALSELYLLLHPECRAQRRIPFVSLTTLLTRVVPDLLPAPPEPGLRFTGFLVLV